MHVPRCIGAPDAHCATRARASRRRARGDASSRASIGPTMPSPPPPRIRVRILTEPIDERESIDFVRSPLAGAISTFIGTARKTYRGVDVLELAYECYEPMALEVLDAVARETCARYAGDGDERRVAVDGRGGMGVVAMDIAHRVGTVGVSETSVVVSCAASHRKDACDAVAEAMELLKARAPIWKKEILDVVDETSGARVGVWKANGLGEHFGRDG